MEIITIHVFYRALAVPEVDDGNAAATYILATLDAAGSQGTWKFPDIESNSCVTTHAMQATAQKHRIKKDKKVFWKKQYPYISPKARVVSCYFNVHCGAAGHMFLPPVCDH